MRIRLESAFIFLALVATSLLLTACDGSHAKRRAASAEETPKTFSKAINDLQSPNSAKLGEADPVSNILKEGSASIPAMIDALKSHPSAEVRKFAIRILISAQLKQFRDAGVVSDLHSSIIEALKAASESDIDQLVQHEASEALEALNDAELEVEGLDARSSLYDRLITPWPNGLGLDAAEAFKEATWRNVDFVKWINLYFDNYFDFLMTPAPSGMGLGPKQTILALMINLFGEIDESLFGPREIFEEAFDRNVEMVSKNANRIKEQFVYILSLDIPQDKISDERAREEVFKGLAKLARPNVAACVDFAFAATPEGYGLSRDRIEDWETVLGMVDGSQCDVFQEGSVALFRHVYTDVIMNGYAASLPDVAPLQMAKHARSITEEALTHHDFIESLDPLMGLWLNDRAETGPYVVLNSGAELNRLLKTSIRMVSIYYDSHEKRNGPRNDMLEKVTQEFARYLGWYYDARPEGLGRPVSCEEEAMEMAELAANDYINQNYVDEQKQARYNELVDSYEAAYNQPIPCGEPFYQFLTDHEDELGFLGRDGRTLHERYELRGLVD